MLTVKEISEITGISIRTLHYYDSIDLLKPTHDKQREKIIKKIAEEIQEENQKNTEEEMI